MLDDYLEAYNTNRPRQGRGMNGRTPIRAFTKGMPKTSNKEVTSQTKKLPNSRSPEARSKCDHCQENTVGVK